MTYSVTPKAYLRRARDLIVSGDNTKLPYAAFELRACIEARQADYYSAYGWKRGQKIRPWQIKDLSKSLHEYWPDQKIAEIIYYLPSGSWTTYFTPVTKPLVKSASEHLGLLLHSVSEDNASNERWWFDRRSKIIDCYRQTWIACKGQHLAMPLWNAATSEMHPAIMYGEDDELDQVKKLAALFSVGTQAAFSIDYLDRAPDSWVCDL